MKSINIKTIILTAITLMVVWPAMAQGAPPATPIDGGLSLLLAAAGAYGVKRIVNSRKQFNHFNGKGTNWIVCTLFLCSSNRTILGTFIK